MEVCRAGRDVQLVLTRDADVVLLLGGGGDGADAEFDGLLVCLLGEGAGEGVAAGVRLGGEVQRDEGKGLAGAAGGKDDVIVVAEPHQFFDVRLCLLVYFVVGGGTVADLEDGHACAVEVEHLALDFFQDVLGQDGGAGVKVIDAFVHFVSPSISYHFHWAPPPSCWRMPPPPFRRGRRRKQHSISRRFPLPLSASCGFGRRARDPSAAPRSCSPPMCRFRRQRGCGRSGR